MDKQLAQDARDLIMMFMSYNAALEFKWDLNRHKKFRSDSMKMINDIVPKLEQIYMGAKTNDQQRFHLTMG